MSEGRVFVIVRRNLLRQYKEDTPTEGYSEYGNVLDRAKNLFDPQNGKFNLQEQENPTANTLGEYKLIERIGQGGMGGIFKARHTKLGRTVAVKVISDARAADGRFRRIAMLLLLMFFFGRLGLAGGIILTIDRNGKKTSVEFPEGSQASVNKDGNVAVRLGQTAGTTLSEKEKEIQKLVGTWKLISLTKGNTPFSNQILKNAKLGKLVINNNTITQNIEGTETIPLEIDVTENPKRIQWPTRTSIDSIYKVEGDRLTIRTPDGVRKTPPTDFTPAAKDRILSFVFERVKTPSQKMTTAKASTYSIPVRSSRSASVATPIAPEHLWNIAPLLSPIKLRASTFYEIETRVALDITNQPDQGVRWEGKTLLVTWPKGFTGGSYTYTKGCYRDPKARTIQWPITPSVSEFEKHNYSYQVKFLTSPPPELKNAKFRVELLDAKAQPVWTNTVQCAVQAGIPNCRTDRQKQGRSAEAVRLVEMCLGTGRWSSDYRERSC